MAISLHNAAAAPATHAAECGHGKECGLVRLLFTINTLMMRTGDRLARPVGLTSSRWLLLCAVGRAEAPRSVGDLSGDALLSVQATSRMLASMEAEGLVTRFARRGAGRAVFVRLTAKGRRALEKTELLAERFELSFLKGFAPVELARLGGDLARLIENLQAFEAELAGDPT